MHDPEFDDPDLTLSELFARWPDLAAVFLDHRMLCPGCPITPFHTISKACARYNLDEDSFRRALCDRLKRKGSS